MKLLSTDMNVIVYLVIIEEVLMEVVSNNVINMVIVYCTVVLMI